MAFNLEMYPVSYIAKYDSKTGKWNTNEGFVIQSRGEHFSIIGTGDNYYTPQIIEITFKK